MEAKPLAGRHILLLEDEMMILLMMEEMLIDLGGASVTSAATVGQALTKIDRQVFDAAVLDVNLNGTKSYPVAERLAARGIPFVFSTGYSDHAPGDAYADRPVLKKPFRYPELASALSRLLSNISTTTATSSPKKGRNHVTGYFDFHHETNRGRRPDARRWTGRRIGGG